MRELCEMWAIQQKVDQEMVEDKAAEGSQSKALMTSIRHATQVNLAMQANIAILGKMRMTLPGHEQTLGFLTPLYQRRIDPND